MSGLTRSAVFERMGATWVVAASAFWLALGPALCLLPAWAGHELPGKLLDLEGAVESMAVDPSGAWFVTGGTDGAIRLWNLRADKPFAGPSFVLRGHSQPARQLVMSPNGRWLVSGSSDGMLRLWDVTAKDPTAASCLLSAPAAKDTPKGHVGWSLEMSGNNRWLVARSLAEPFKTRLWDLQAEDPKAKSVVLESTATLQFCPNRRWLVGGAQSNAEKAQVWDLNAEDPWAKNVALEKPRKASLEALSLDGRWLFARHRDLVDKSRDNILMWDLRDLKEANPPPCVLISHPWASPPRAGEVSPDGRWLAIAFDVEPYGVDLWELRGNDPTSQHSVLLGHRNTIRKLIFSPNSRWLVAGADDITARVWDLQAPRPAGSCRVLSFNAELAVVAPNNRWLALSDKHALSVWNLEDPDLAGSSVSLGDVGKGVWVLHITPDSRWLVTHGEDKAARCWDLRGIKPKVGSKP
jgi:WD40 repeat protein